MIFPDGSRSTKLSWLANKLVRQIRSLGIQSKSIIYNGFLVKSQVVGDIENSIIKAPTGLRVICSTDEGFSCWDFPHIFGSCEGRTKAFGADAILGYQVTKTTVNNGFSQQVRELSQQVVESSDDWFMYDDFSNLVEAISHNSRPVLLPVKDSELVSRVISVRQDAYDSASRPTLIDISLQSVSLESGTTEPPSTIPMATRRAISVETDNAWDLTWAVQLIGSSVLRGIRTYQGVFNFYNADMSSQSTSSNRTIATVLEGNWSKWATLTDEQKALLNYLDFNYRYIRTNTIWAGLPSTLASLLNSSTYDDIDPQLYIVGNYAREVNSKCVLLTVSKPAHTQDYFRILGLTCYGDNPDALCPFRDDNLDTRQWKLFYTIHTDGPDPLYPALNTSVITVNATNMLGTLHHLYQRQYGSINLDADPPISAVLTSYPAGWVHTDLVDLTNTAFKVDWARAIAVLQRLVSYPNATRTDVSLYDSVMFHSPLSVFSWDRIYNVIVEFSATGLNIVPHVLPDDVYSIGVRPLITYSHTENEVDSYLCVCERIGTEFITNFTGIEVLACYYGSPFSTWTRLPDISEGKLRHVKPVKHDSAEIILMGIIEIENRFYSAFLRYLLEPEDGTITEWVKLAEIPLEVKDANVDSRRIWDLCPYGSGIFPKETANYATHPSAVGQQYYMDYSFYTEKLP